MPVNMPVQLRPDLIAKYRAARVHLRAQGRRDTQDNVHQLVGGSRQTLVRYWRVSDPAHPEAAEVLPAVVTVPEAPPEPPFSYENLRRYYVNRHTSCWPNGVRMPLEVLPLLDVLWQEYDSVVAKAARERYTVQNTYPRGGAEDALAQVEARRSAAALVCQSIDIERTRLRQRARDEGRTV